MSINEQVLGLVDSISDDEERKILLGEIEARLRNLGASSLSSTVETREPKPSPEDALMELDETMAECLPPVSFEMFTAELKRLGKDVSFINKTWNNYVRQSAWATEGEPQIIQEYAPKPDQRQLFLVSRWSNEVWHRSVRLETPYRDEQTVQTQNFISPADLHAAIRNGGLRTLETVGDETIRVSVEIVNGLIEPSSASKEQKSSLITSLGRMVAVATRSRRARN